MLTTDQKGAIAESAILHAAIKLGIGVYRPLFDGGRYDFIFDLGTRLLRVQCKWAARRGDVVVVRCYSCRRTRDGQLKRRRDRRDRRVLRRARSLLLLARREDLRPEPRPASACPQSKQPERRCELG